MDETLFVINRIVTREYSVVCDKESIAGSGRVLETQQIFAMSKHNETIIDRTDDDAALLINHNFK